MIAKLVRFALRFKRVRAEAVKCLVYDLSQKREAERRERKFGRRKRNYCFDCQYFGTAMCDSRNPRGWCRKFEEK